MRTLSALLFTAALAAAADPKPTEPFNGKDLTGWKLKDEKKSQWKATAVGTDEKGTGFIEKELKRDTPLQLVNVKGGGCDISTEAKFGDCTIELEFMVPKGSNSGIYVMGEYEVQVLDSFGKADDKLTEGDLGAIYSAAKPKKNLAKKPGEWQSVKIEFEAPKFDGDKKTKNAKFVKVTLNGEVLHENVEMKQQTPGGLTGKEMATGPLMFQGDHGPVAFRNIKVTPMK
ncbi:MAG: 3-keto-disaccharide hydrolase [Armatimonadaceae bacterium]